MVLSFKKSLCATDDSVDVLCDHTGKIRHMHHRVGYWRAILSWRVYSWRMTELLAKASGKIDPRELEHSAEDLTGACLSPSTHNKFC